MLGSNWLPGQLEVFPNCKAYVTSGEHSLYNGHRLPYASGVVSTESRPPDALGQSSNVCPTLAVCLQRNSLDTKALERLLKAARRRQFASPGKADKFLNDLNAEIEQGWTGPGQTNRLLGRIAMRSYIFGMSSIPTAR
jgi:hypothetical protein